MPKIPILAEARQLSRERPLWLVDIWGVLHNGVAPFPSTVDALARHRAGGGCVVLVTNAPRPAASVDTQLKALGVPRGAYDAIVTSGDVTHALLVAEGKKPAYHIGPERDVALFQGLPLELVAPDRAELVVCTGLFDDTVETPETYRATLEALARRRVPMICANPDLRVERGHQIIPCAGAVAQLYATLGGIIAYAGKPYAPIYTLARERAHVAMGRAATTPEILCIGDGLSTDIRGAHDQGLDVLFVASAVDLGGQFSARSVEALFEPTPYRPLGAQAQLTW